MKFDPALAFISYREYIDRLDQLSEKLRNRLITRQSNALDNCGVALLGDLDEDAEEYDDDEYDLPISGLDIVNGKVIHDLEIDALTTENIGDDSTPVLDIAAFLVMQNAVLKQAMISLAKGITNDVTLTGVMAGAQEAVVKERDRWEQHREAVRKLKGDRTALESLSTFIPEEDYRIMLQIFQEEHQKPASSTANRPKPQLGRRHRIIRSRKNR